MQAAESYLPTFEERLRAVPVFSDLSHEDLAWLASRMELVSYQPGDVIVQEGSPADKMLVILEGEIYGQREHGLGDGRTYTARAGQVTGMLPYSRLTHFPLTTRATTAVTAALLDSSEFPEMLKRLPGIDAKLVGVLADRIRETTKADQQREKLMALGKLSAGLAHELNNPAASVTNAAVALREAVEQLRMANLRLDKRTLPAEDRVFLARLECDWVRSHPPAALDSLERSDREEQMGDWLQAHNIADARVLAANLVDSGGDLKMLQMLASRFDSDSLADVVTRLTGSFTVSRLVEEIHSGTQRMSQLVKAVKEYSYMDQAPEQEIDIHDGLEKTLIMLHYRLKHGVEVTRDYDRTLPRICARGNELNQVWTNLIDNAIDAMNGQGELLVRTAREYGRVLVEIRDNGPGIPPELRNRIFEPFFTTKAVGEGTGLGLDTVYHVVQNHKGTLRLESEPGRTSFQVRLPLADASGKQVAAEAWHVLE